MKAWKLLPSFAALCLLGSPALAQITTFTASLTGAQEVPSTGSPGTGSGTLQFNTSTLAWSLTGTFTGLQGTANNAHIHGPAIVGQSAGVVVGISFTSGATSGTFSGSGTFSSAQANDLTQGLYYINLHSTSFGGGEIRGQLTAVPEPATFALGAGVAGLIAVMIRRGRSARVGPG